MGKNMPQGLKVLLIIPAFNEAKNIRSVVAAVREYAGRTADYQLDYIVINDGSTDATAQICTENKIPSIMLVHNLGIGGAVQTGYLFAAMRQYDIAVQFDGDGQHDIRSLDKLIAPILSGEADFTVGSRFLEGTSHFQSTRLRRVGIRFLSQMIRITAGIRILDTTSGYRAASRRVLEIFAKNYPEDYPEPESLVALSMEGVRVREVQVNMFERMQGVSSISAWRSVYYMLKVSLAIVCAGFQRRKSQCQ